MKVLIADDDPVSSRLLQRIVERSGFEVVSVADGESALAILQSEDGPRMAILDWMMPGKNGLAVCRELRSQEGHPYIYLILLTSREAVGDIVAGFEAGADDYLIKPCRLDELKARMRAGHRILTLQDSLVREASHDALTSLPNRSCLLKRLAESCQHARVRHSYSFLLLFVDLDNFKLINDSLGHLVGDEVIRGVGERLQQVVRSDSDRRHNLARQNSEETIGDLVARIGGDEFVILINHADPDKDGTLIARRVEEALRAPFRIAEQDIYVTASIGIATSDGLTTDPVAILRKADAAMYHAKLQGKARFEVNAPARGQGKVGVFRLQNDLRIAQEQDQLEIHYQAIINLSQDMVHGYEALLRWRHPLLGYVPPETFIPIAEESGMIIAIGSWVMEESCRQLRRWTKATREAADLVMSINISPQQFRDNGLVETVLKCLSMYDLEASSLDFEVTEHFTMQDVDNASQMLDQLQRIGVTLSLDDFGTGYSSLSHLLKSPMQHIKVDRSFVKDIELSLESFNIVQSTIVLAHSLGMKVVAEGVETSGQLAILRRLGCDFAQGFLFAKPMPADEVLHKLIESEAVPQTSDSAVRSPLLPQPVATQTKLHEPVAVASLES